MAISQYKPQPKVGKGPNPYLLAALPGLISGVAGGFFGNEEGERQEALTREQLAASERARHEGTALSATQMNPLAQQEARQQNAIRASLLSRSTRSNVDDPSSGVNWNPADFAAFFTPEARANAEAGFNANAAVATGNRYVPQTGVGYGGAGTAGTPGSALVSPADADWRARTDYSDPNDPRGAGAVGGLLGGAGTGASLGSLIPGVGTAVGAGVGAAIGGLGGLIGGRSNDTKGSREALARSLGYGDINGLNAALNAVGPEGQKLVDIGLNRIGRKDTTAQAEWDRQVQRLLAGRKPQPAPAAPAAPGGTRYLTRNPNNPNPTLANILRGRE